MNWFFHLENVFWRSRWTTEMHINWFESCSWRTQNHPYILRDNTWLLGFFSNIRYLGSVLSPWKILKVGHGPSPVSEGLLYATGSNFWLCMHDFWLSMEDVLRLRKAHSSFHGPSQAWEYLLDVTANCRCPPKWLLVASGRPFEGSGRSAWPPEDLAQPPDEFLWHRDLGPLRNSLSEDFDSQEVVEPLQTPRAHCIDRLFWHPHDQGHTPWHS